MDKAVLRHEVSNSLVLLQEELGSFIANAEHRLYRKAISNLYYAAYDMTCALLWSKGIRCESHDGAQSMLSLHFVKAGSLPADTTKHLNNLMAMRHAADYKGEVQIAASDVREKRTWVVNFVERALPLIEGGGLKVDLGKVKEVSDRMRKVGIVS